MCQQFDVRTHNRQPFLLDQIDGHVGRDATRRAEQDDAPARPGCSNSNMKGVWVPGCLDHGGCCERLDLCCVIKIQKACDAP